eukprot:6501119-Lingulodinium_polyedra.AAC.1
MGTVGPITTSFGIWQTLLGPLLQGQRTPLVQVRHHGALLSSSRLRPERGGVPVEGQIRAS